MTKERELIELLKSLPVGEYRVTVTFDGKDKQLSFAPDKPGLAQSMALSPQFRQLPQSTIRGLLALLGK